MGARVPSESVGGLDRNQCPGWAGISGRIAPEYAPGSVIERSTKFVLQTGSLREFTGLLALIHAMDYQLVINRKVVGILRVGLVGEHEFFPAH